MQDVALGPLIRPTCLSVRSEKDHIVGCAVRNPGGRSDVDVTTRGGSVIISPLGKGGVTIGHNPTVTGVVSNGLPPSQSLPSPSLSACCK